MNEEKVYGDEPGRRGNTSTASTLPGLPAHDPQSETLRTSLDTRGFRRTMGLFATGVTVITTRVNNAVHGMTANSITSLSLDPLLILVAINRRASMCNIIQQAGEFVINILNDRQEALSHYFGGAKIGPPPASLRFEPNPGNVPYIRGTLAAVHCRIERVVDGGDHVIVLGRVLHFHDGLPTSPLVYFRGRYCSLRDLETETPSLV